MFYFSHDWQLMIIILIISEFLFQQQPFHLEKKKSNILTELHVKLQ